MELLKLSATRRCVLVVGHRNIYSVFSCPNWNILWSKQENVIWLAYRQKHEGIDYKVLLQRLLNLEIQEARFLNILGTS